MTLRCRRAVRGAAWVLVVAAVGCLAGCASLSVAHLESRPFVAGVPTTIPMKFWKFAYTGALDGKAYRLRGLATPVMTDLPSWVDRVEELTLSVYLRDQEGNVLSSAQKTYRAMPLHPDTPVPFEFVLTPSDEVGGKYGISFGYKAVYGSCRVRAAVGAPKGPPPAGAVFFAGEGAVLKH